jgi:phosphatidylinositol-3-phosphatase
MRRFLALATSASVLWGCTASTGSAAPPAIRHIFVIVLENEDYGTTFGPSPGSAYLAKTLPSQGALLTHYFGIGHESLDNYIAMISGQPPNVQTQADCQGFSNFPPAPLTSIGADGIVTGQGCVYPPATQTVANQLDSDGLRWRAYGQDMANSVSAGQPASCRHPNLNSQDSTQSAKANDQYATRHVPFVYFHSIIDSSTCAQNVVDLKELPADLAQADRTPAYTFITPDLCADGHDATCPDGAPGGFAGIDKFLREWVPKITGSPAYEDRGMLLVTFDEAENDASSCCNEQPGPNTPNPGGPTPGSGGGRVGAVALSPCINPGTTSDQPYNHYSLLRWVEDNFGLFHLGFAAQQGLRPLGSDVFTRPGCEETPQLTVEPRHPRAGRRTAFRFRVDSPLRRCKQGVLVRFAGKSRRTDDQGRAWIRKRFRHRGRRVARVFAEGCDPASKRVRIGRRR